MMDPDDVHDIAKTDEIIMAAEYQWRPFRGDCPLCGGSAEVFCKTGVDNWANDGDKVRCSECHHEGSVVIEEEGESCSNFVNWDDDL